MSRGRWPTPTDDELLEELRDTDRLTLVERKNRLRFLAQETEGPEGASIPGLEFEAGLMLGDAFKSFVDGSFLASVLSAQAFLEHCLTTALDACGERGVSRLNFFKVINKCEGRGLLNKRLAKKIHRLRTLRNPYAHRHRKAGKDWPSFFHKRVMKEADGSYYALAERDAKLGVECIVDYIRSINPSWIPPR